MCTTTSTAIAAAATVATATTNRLMDTVGNIMKEDCTRRVVRPA